MILQIVISVLTVISMWLIGSKNIAGWLISLGTQALWLCFIVETKSWGLLPLNIAMWVTCIRALNKWRRSPDPAVK